jgi:hypothetical protein
MSSILRYRASTYIAAIALSALIVSCTSVAKISDLPTNSEKIDFSKIALMKKTKKDKAWNSKKEYEYYICTPVNSPEKVMASVLKGLQLEEYAVNKQSLQNGVVLAERGLRANEWNSVAGIYFIVAEKETHIYICCKITQDITGGWRNDRAKEIGDAICTQLNGFKSAYAVKSK